MNFSEFEACTDRTWSLIERESKIAAALGVGGESGEVIEIIKKECFHNKPADPEKLRLEVGDVLFYLARIARSYGFTLEGAAIANNKKLLKRRPNGHLPTYYIHRNSAGVVFVKESAFFAKQGGLKQDWGRNWISITANSIEDARLRGDQILPR